MKVLLVQPPIEDFYTTPIRLYPLGLLYAARILEDAGAEVAVLDCLSPPKKRQIPIPVSFGYLPPLDRIPHFFKGYYRFGLSDEEILRRVDAFSPDLIGISAQFTAYYENVERLAQLFKSRSPAPIFIGGHHATVFAPEVRRRTPEIDFVLEGPAERCLPEFLRSFGKESSWERPGTAGTVKRGAGMVGGADAGVDWRSLQPAHHLVRGADYRIGRKIYISLSAGRGCPYGCDFCSVHRMFGRKAEYRSVDSVLDEMRASRSAKDASVFNFEDDNLSFDRAWFLEFLRAAASDPTLRGAELTAMNGLCHNTLDVEVLSAMRAAGFRELNVSLVTASPELRGRHRRPEIFDRFDKFAGLIREARRLSFFVTAYVIIGLPGQTYEEARATVDGLLALDVLVGPSVYYAAPGSPLHEREGLPPAVRDDWNLCRSSAFAVETPDFRRAQQLELFSYVREKNLERRITEFRACR
jgi:radical SAM superfamily enzyme YgiQ (UPF0313 family)